MIVVNASCRFDPQVGCVVHRIRPGGRECQCGDIAEEEPKGRYGGWTPRGHATKVRAYLAEHQDRLRQLGVEPESLI